MNAEVLSHKKRSEDTLGSIEYHKKVIAGCDGILTELNPEYAERRAQSEEIALLKTQMAELMKMNKDLLSRLDSGTSA